jgi:hypothetical protein
MKLSDILNQAADLILERGLHKGTLRSPDGTQFCAVGAICHVAQTTNAVEFGDKLGSGRLFAWLNNRLPISVHLSDFNDDSETTDADVIDFLRSAAIAAKEELD